MAVLLSQVDVTATKAYGSLCAPRIVVNEEKLEKLSGIVREMEMIIACHDTVAPYG